jgi:hypothetical protein
MSADKLTEDKINNYQRKDNILQNPVALKNERETERKIVLCVCVCVCVRERERERERKREREIPFFQESD